MPRATKDSQAAPRLDPGPLQQSAPLLLRNEGSLGNSSACVTATSTFPRGPHDGASLGWTAFSRLKGSHLGLSRSSAKVKDFVDLDSRPEGRTFIAFCGFLGASFLFEGHHVSQSHDLGLGRPGLRCLRSKWQSRYGDSNHDLKLVRVLQGPAGSLYERPADATSDAHFSQFLNSRLNCASFVGATVKVAVKGRRRHRRRYIRVTQGGKAATTHQAHWPLSIVALARTCWATTRLELGWRKIVGVTWTMHTFSREDTHATIGASQF